MKLHTLGIFAHPDDAEICAGGTILSLINQGNKVGLADLTEGELGTRGSVPIRYKEAAVAAKILGLSVRENLQLPDGLFVQDNESLLKAISIIRKYQPEIVLTNALSDRHPDHGLGASLVDRACFLAGLRKIITTDEHGQEQAYWRPKQVYFGIQSDALEPDFIVDVSPFWDRKMEAIKAYKSQFFDPNSKEPETFIASSGFIDLLNSRGVEHGMAIRTKYGEGFQVKRKLGVKQLTDLI